MAGTSKADRKGQNVVTQDSEREDRKKKMGQPPSPPMEFTNQRNRPALILDKAVESELNRRPDVDPSNVNIRKLRRTVSNRLSAQRSRQKKSCYLDALKNSADELEQRVALLRSQVEGFEERIKELRRERDGLQSLMQTHLIGANLREWEIEQTQKELNELKEAHKTLTNHTNYESSSQYQMQSCQLGLEFYQNLGQEQQLPGGSGQSAPALALGQNQLPPAEGLPLQDEEEEALEEIDKFINYETVMDES